MRNDGRGVKNVCVRCVVRRMGVGEGEGARVKDCGAPAIKAAVSRIEKNTTSFAITVLVITPSCVLAEAMLPGSKYARKVKPQIPTRPSMTKLVCATAPPDTAAVVGDRLQPPDTVV